MMRFSVERVIIRAKEMYDLKQNLKKSGWRMAMDAKEKIEFLSQKVKELNKIVSELEEVFPEKSFTLDGILAGNIVEAMVAQIYGITLYKQSEKTHDGEVDGRKIQIKGTQGKNAIVIRELPDYLIVVKLDKATGTIQEIYNGPGDRVWQYRKYVPSMNHYTIRVNKLLEVNEQINACDRIPSLIPVEKYVRIQVESNKAVGSKTKSTGKTLQTGYVNKNNQENKGCLNKPGNHYNQMAYLMHCNMCGYEYESNGCDVAIRKCPKCM